MENRERTMIALDHWHIEPSSICTLKCPRCPRAEVPETLLNKWLSLDFFKERIGEEVVKSIQKITFCGNDGDPIYCKEFIEICEWLKQVNPTISLVIVTNGSHKTEEWWKRLASILNEYDEINWSIDGWDQATNVQYRVNSLWQTIINGIKTFTTHNTSTYRVLATIAFSFNERGLGRIRRIAANNDFDLWQLTKSTKFGSKYPGAYGEFDPLEPSTDYVSSSHRFERKLDFLTQRKRWSEKMKDIYIERANELNRANTYAGICMIGNKGVFLNSRGEFYPCCWTANRYEHNKMWHDLAETKFNLHNRKFSDIMDDEFWSTDFLKFDSLECQTKCTKPKLIDIVHISEW